MSFAVDLAWRAIQSAVASLGTTIFGILFGFVIAVIATALRLRATQDWKMALGQHWQDNLKHFAFVAILAWAALLAYQFWHVTQDINVRAARVVVPAPPPPPVTNVPVSTPHVAKEQSYVFLVPGVWVGTDAGYPNTGSWDFIVNHRGPDTSFNVEILFVDTVAQKQVLQGKSSLTAADLDRYERILKFPEVDAHGHGSIFATQFLWKPVEPDHEHYQITATWRDGAISEDLAIERLKGKWFWAMQIKDRDTGKMLVDCKDKGFPFGARKPRPCFPDLTKVD